MKQTLKELLHRYAFIFSVFMVFYPALFIEGGLFKWVDDEGVVHMTDSLSQVPPQYRNQVENKNYQTANPSDAERESRPIAANENGAGHLKHFEVPYEPFEGNSRRIIIPATLNDSVTANLLLDTGSPGLMISPELANRLGLPNENDEGLKVLTGGIGGSTPATLAVIDTIKIGDATAGFFPTAITNIPSRAFEGLVGMDFLANYKISIDISRSVVIFNEISSQSIRPGGHEEAWWRSNFELISRLRTEWGNFLEKVKTDDAISNEKDRRIKIAKKQFEEADNLYRRLDRYARENVVPINWRR
jgi:hypothetical protein